MINLLISVLFAAVTMCDNLIEFTPLVQNQFAIQFTYKPSLLTEEQQATAMLNARFTSDNAFWNAGCNLASESLAGETYITQFGENYLTQWSGEYASLDDGLPTGDDDVQFKFVFDDTSYKLYRKLVSDEDYVQMASRTTSHGPYGAGYVTLEAAGGPVDAICDFELINYDEDGNVVVEETSTEEDEESSEAAAKKSKLAMIIILSTVGAVALAGGITGLVMWLKNKPKLSV
jgi:hypothetical protein